MAKSQSEIDVLVRKKPNVLSWRNDLTKIKDGKDTGKSCLTIFVSSKIERKFLRQDVIIPKEINGVPTDVVELDSNGDFELGETSIALKTPEEQKRIMGLRRDG